MKKGMTQKHGIALVITLVIIAAIFILGPAIALIISIDGLPPVVGSLSAVTFFLNFDLSPGELIPGGFTLNINGLPCNFDVNANKLGGIGCFQANCELIHHGHHKFGPINANNSTVFYGYGYGYQFGYGYHDGELRYRCRWNSPCAQVDTIIPFFFTTTVDGITFNSGTAFVTVQSNRQCQGGGHPGSGDAYAAPYGGCCDPVVNFAQWHCCQKALIARVQCCAQPQHPSCSSYCKLLKCVDGYAMNPITGNCVMAHPLEEQAPMSGTSFEPVVASVPKVVQAVPLADEQSLAGKAAVQPISLVSNLPADKSLIYFAFMMGAGAAGFYLFWKKHSRPEF